MADQQQTENMKKYISVLFIRVKHQRQIQWCVTIFLNLVCFYYINFNTLMASLLAESLIICLTYYKMTGPGFRDNPRPGVFVSVYIPRFLFSYLYFYFTKICFLNFAFLVVMCLNLNLLKKRNC